MYSNHDKEVSSTDQFSLDSVPFLSVDGELVSIGQIFTCFQLFGRLQPFVQECLRYYAVYGELLEREDLAISSSELAQVIMDFRLNNDLTDPDKFGRWLLSQGTNYPGFESQTIIALKLEKLKAKILEEQAEPYFHANKAAFDQVEINYVVVAEEELAQQIKEKLLTGTSFDQLAQDYPLDLEQKVVVKRDVLPRQRLRQEIQEAIATTTVKDMVGPIVMQQRWCVFRVEQIISTTFDDALRNSLKDVLFNQWLAKKLETTQIGLPPSHPSHSEVSKVSDMPTEVVAV